MLLSWEDENKYFHQVRKYIGEKLDVISTAYIECQNIIAMVKRYALDRQKQYVAVKSFRKKSQEAE